MAIKGTAAILAAMLAPWATVARADEPTAQPSSQSAENPSPAATKKEWKFATVGYIWFSGIEGETDVIGPLPPVGLDLSFGTIMKHFKLGFMGAAEARRDRLVLLGDLMWVHLSAKKGIDIRDRDFLDAKLNSKTLVITALGGYRVADKGPVVVDLLAGGRLNRTKTSLTLTGPERTASGSVAQTWVDPVVAVRAIAPLGEKVSLTLYGDVGGIVVGSNVSWQGLATINYQISRKIRVGAGWRYYKVDYDKGDFLYDVAQSGPILTFRTDF